MIFAHMSTRQWASGQWRPCHTDVCLLRLQAQSLRQSRLLMSDECWMNEKIRAKGRWPWGLGFLGGDFALSTHSPLWAMSHPWHWATLWGHCTSRSSGWGGCENKQGRRKQGVCWNLENVLFLAVRICHAFYGRWVLRSLRGSIVVLGLWDQSQEAKERQGNVKWVSLFALCECLCFQTEETLTFPSFNYLIILTPWPVASP